MNKMNKIILTNIALIPIIYQLCGLRDFTINNDLIQYVSTITLNIILIIYILKNNLKFDKEVMKKVILLFIAVVGIPFVFWRFTDQFYVRNLMFIGLYINTMLLFILISVYSKTYKIEVLKAFLTGNTFILGVGILFEINKISISLLVNNCISLFNDGIRERLYFGFNHPNLAAIYILCEVILINIIYGKNKNIKFITNTIGYILLITTASRTAVFALTIYIIMKIFIKFIFSINKYLRGMVISTVIISFIIFGAYNNGNNSVTNKIESLEVRSDDIKTSINYLIENDIILLGIGPVSHTKICVFDSQLKAPDNGYISFIIQFGILGFSFVMLTIGSIVIKCIKNRDYNTLSIIGMFLFYSLSEATLFVPGVFITLLIWIIMIVSCIKVDSEIYLWRN